MGRFDLTDRQWERLEPLLPPRRPRTGRPTEDHRRLVNGIVWVLRTGAPWRDLPERYGPVGTVSGSVARFADRWRSGKSGGPDGEGRGLARSRKDPFEGSAVHGGGDPLGDALVPAVPDQLSRPRTDARRPRGRGRPHHPVEAVKKSRAKSA